MNHIRKISVVLLLMCLFVNCKKDKVDDNPYAIDKSKTYLNDTLESTLRDSVWYYYKILSLWEGVIPPNLKGDLERLDELGFLRKNYTQYFETGDKTLDYLMSLTKDKNPNRTPASNYDWYSFLDGTGVVRGELSGGITSGLGFSVFYLQTEASGTNAYLYMDNVDLGSAAYEAGFRRGDRILSLNGDTKIDYDYQKANQFSTVSNYLYRSELEVEAKKPDGTILKSNVIYKSFRRSPISLDKVVTINNKKVGYFVLKSFDSIKDNGYYTAFYTELENMFARFEEAGIDELVVDLRHNGGGDVVTAEYLADRIAPRAVDGKLMYTYKINRFLEDWGWLEEGEEFAPVKFAKRGNLDLSRVYFLVTSSTASASELLINSLKPVMNTYLVGTYVVNDEGKQVAENTYGKPVGFFGLAIAEEFPELRHIELYAASFKMYNSNGVGDYYDGLIPNYHVSEFRSFYDFGDEKEAMLSAALGHINTGTFTATNRSVAPGNYKLVANKLKTSKDLGSHSKAKNGMYLFLNKKPKIK